jgi:hypothetical protein
MAAHFTRFEEPEERDKAATAFVHPITTPTNPKNLWALPKPKTEQKFTARTGDMVR